MPRNSQEAPTEHQGEAPHVDGVELPMSVLGRQGQHSHGPLPGMYIHGMLPEGLWANESRKCLVKQVKQVFRTGLLRALSPPRGRFIGR